MQEKPNSRVGGECDNAINVKNCIVSVQTIRSKIRDCGPIRDIRGPYVYAVSKSYCAVCRVRLLAKGQKPVLDVLYDGAVPVNLPVG